MTFLFCEKFEGGRLERVVGESSKLKSRIIKSFIREDKRCGVRAAVVDKFGMLKIQHVFSPVVDFARSHNAGALTNDP